MGRTEVGQRHFEWELVLRVTRYPLNVTESGLAAVRMETALIPTNSTAFITTPNRLGTPRLGAVRRVKYRAGSVWITAA